MVHSGKSLGRKLRFLAAGALLGLLLTGCLRLTGGARTPIEAVKAQWLSPDANVVNFRVLGVREAPDGSQAVIYTYFEPSSAAEPGIYHLGATILRPAPLGGWQPASGGGAGSSQRPDEAQLIDYFSMQGARNTILGQTLSSQVGSLEALLSDGQTQVDPADDGAFAFFSPEGGAVCRLRVLGLQGEVLKEDAFFSDEPGHPCSLPDPAGTFTP